MSRAFYVVTVEVDPRVQAEWLEWYVRVHVPEVLAAEPGFLGARRFRDEQPGAGGWLRYQTVFEAGSSQALERYFQAPATVKLRADYQQRFGTTTRLARQVWTELTG